MLASLNPTLWVIGNLLVGYIALALIVFTIGYYVLFDPKATTAGKLIFRFFVSMVGLVLLSFISIYIDPDVDELVWWTLPPDVEVWSPLLRVIVYGYVSFTITALAIFLGMRKWRPQKFMYRRDGVPLKVRNDTTEIPIIPSD